MSGPQTIQFAQNLDVIWFTQMFIVYSIYPDDLISSKWINILEEKNGHLAYWIFRRRKQF